MLGQDRSLYVPVPAPAHQFSTNITLWRCTEIGYAAPHHKRLKLARATPSPVLFPSYPLIEKPDSGLSGSVLAGASSQPRLLNNPSLGVVRAAASPIQWSAPRPESGLARAAGFTKDPLASTRA